ncbi:MAG: Clp protease N-terminal domain-containing protein, partial [Patescibacteria group bacterium]
MDQHHILENLSTHLKNSIARAISLATSMKHAKVSLIHLLLALQEEQGSIAADILTKFNLDKQCLLFFLSKKPLADLPRKSATLEAIMPELDAPSKQTLERAMLLAYEREHSYIGTEHLLHSIFCSKDRDIAAILENLKISRKKLIDQIEIVLNSTTHFPDIDEISETFEQIQSIVEQQSALPLPGMSDAPISHIKKGNLQKKIKQPPTALEIFTVELTNKRRQQNIDPVIGREKEIERLINILCRRTKNNPVLIGEPGVGKTAIIEGLA